ncbi:Hypothetical protein FKW44_015762 [Caligus rogercresseyi]|uniref:Uncharacterized protein n=1 Tax=Caligus rogercresseyi TaxID=217165 RepID=A0A7T8H0S4_CALRO|nr:Hypothetical protein FKW44_015762 [Caligus rogercresseyi]
MLNYGIVDNFWSSLQPSTTRHWRHHSDLRSSYTDKRSGKWLVMKTLPQAWVGVLEG